MGQRRGIALILAAAAVCLLLAGVGAYGSYAVLDELAFADRAASTLDSDEVREEVAARIAMRVVQAEPRLAGGAAAVEDAAGSLIDTQEFRGAYWTAAVHLHRVLFADGDAEASLAVADSGADLRRRLEALPGWGAVPAIEDPSLLAIQPAGPEGALRELAPVAADVTLPLTIAFAALGAALLGFGIVRAATRRRGVWAAGITIATAGGLLAAAITGAQDLVLHQFDTGFGDAVVSQVWTAYLGDLRVCALAAGACGLVVAAAAGGPHLSPRRLLATPASSGGRIVRALGLLAVAAFAVALPEMVLHLGLVTLAAVLVYVAAGELLRVLAPPDCAARAARAVVATSALLVLILVATVGPA
jgi:hypothetical protein